MSLDIANKKLFINSLDEFVGEYCENVDDPRELWRIINEHSQAQLQSQPESQENMIGHLTKDETHIALTSLMQVFPNVTINGVSEVPEEVNGDMLMDIPNSSYGVNKLRSVFGCTPVYANLNAMLLNAGHPERTVEVFIRQNIPQKWKNLF